MTEGKRGLTRRDLLKTGAVGAAGFYLTGGPALARGLRADGTTLTWLTWFDHFFPQQLEVTKKKTGIGCHPKLAPSDSEIYTTIRQTGSQFDIAAIYIPESITVVAPPAKTPAPTGSKH